MKFLWSDFFLSSYYLWDRYIHVLTHVGNLFRFTEDYRTEWICQFVFHSSIQYWLFVSSLWNKLVNNAAMNIHIPIAVGNVLWLESLRCRASISLTLLETIIIHPTFSTHDTIYSFVPLITPNTFHFYKVWEDLILSSKFLQKRSFHSPLHFIIS